MSGLNGMNGDWRTANRASVYFTDEEVFQLSHIDETWHEPSRYPGGTIIDHEMQCQRDMRVRGKRLWNYHLKLGDLWVYFPDFPLVDVLTSSTVTGIVSAGDVVMQ